jgi:hypothetical protein
LSLMIRTILFAAFAATLFAQGHQIVRSDQGKPIVDEMGKLRDLPDDERVSATRRLGLQIRQPPASPLKEGLADSLAHLVTEGDPVTETLQEVATTLA